ncbi:MAG TPA: molybdopterin molybdenumtransferase MoeA [Bacteroidetes bacterium]|nr:molybdopterin molybdenumtransferase MoeA [Bacteroidota bacterium]
MISIKEAINIIRANLPEIEFETVAVTQSLGRIIAEDIPAPEPSPRYTNSAMDGFAVCWQDVISVKVGGNVQLPIAGESCAGIPFSEKVPGGTAVRINTGALMPEGTDSVVPIEEAEENDDMIRVLNVSKKNQHVRFQGEEFQTGTVVLEKENRITPSVIGLLTALGIENVPVFKRPKVAVIVTGTELVANSTEIAPWQIRDSNGAMLSSAVKFSGGDVIAIEQCSDDLSSIQEKIRNRAKDAQILVVSGGVSVGPHDLVKEAARLEQFEPLFWRVNQKPGKPLFLAHKNGVLFFGLPGNPVSALNCFAYYIHPVLQRLQGSEFHWQKTSGILIHEAVNKGRRTLFLRVQITERGEEQPRIIPLSAQGSHMLTSLVQADGFILFRPQETKSAGDSVQVFLYPWRRK